MVSSCSNSPTKQKDNSKFIKRKKKDGTTQILGAIINGKKEGLWIDLNDSGQLSSQKIFIHDKITGETIHYFEDGKTILETGYLNDGKRSGRWISYYYNHIMDEEGIYTDGQRSGVWKYYLDNGLLEKEVLYQGKKEKIILDNHLLPDTPNFKKDGRLKIDSNNRATVK